MRCYMLKQPGKLERLAMIKLGDWIALQAEKLMTPISELHKHDATKADADLSRQIETLRNYLECNLPSMFHDNLATETMQSLLSLLFKTEPYGERVLQENVIGRRMIETLFTKNLSAISFDSSAWERFHTSFYSKSYMLTGLTYLNFRGYSTEANILKSLKELRSLKFLTVRSICTDNILKCLIENCKFIENLDLINSDINDDSIGILSQLRNLRNVKLYQTKVSEKGIATLLMACKNIEHIGTYVDIIHVLEQIVSLEENSGKRFELKSYDNHTNKTTLIELQLLFKLCPKIQKIKLDKQETFQNDLLMALIDSHDLNELELESFDFYTDQIKEVLQECGRKLVNLHLEEVGQIDLNALLCIYRMCPNLQNLTFYDCSFVTHDLLSHEIEIPPLLYLKKLAVTGWEVAPKRDHLIFLLSNCPNIEIIIPGLPIDNIMLQVMDKNPLIYLKELRIPQRKLSTFVLDRVIQNCINYPEVTTSY